MSEPFIAEVRLMPYNFAPRGWAFCDGTLLPISQYSALFALIGTTYGGDGRTTMGLPNLQGRVAMHPGSGLGLTPRSLGQTGGVERVALTASQLAAHGHAMTAKDEDAASTTLSGNALANTDDETYEDPGAGGGSTPMSPDCTANVGDGQPHNNLQPYLTLNYCIALVGLFPSRN